MTILAFLRREHREFCPDMKCGAEQLWEAHRDFSRYDEYLETFEGEHMYFVPILLLSRHFRGTSYEICPDTPSI